MLTGTLSSMTRDAAADLIRQQGGRVVGSVSSKTDFLVAGADPGARKLEQAEKANVPILTETALFAKLGVSADGALGRGREPAPPAQRELF